MITSLGACSLDDAHFGHNTLSSLRVGELLVSEPLFVLGVGENGVAGS